MLVKEGTSTKQLINLGYGLTYSNTRLNQLLISVYE